MRVVLFGAGASIGSGSVLSYAPPLGKDLYSELRREFPRSWGLLPTTFDGAFRKNFEEGMGQIHDADNPVIPTLMKEMAMYFAKFHLDYSANNLYVLFLAKVQRRKEILYSTLNYDLLFEIAADINGLDISWFDNAKSDSNSITFKKLHGSCNFILKGIITNKNGVTIPMKGRIDGPLQPISSQQVFEYCQSNEAAYPAMCLYMKSKPSQFGHSRIAQLQDSWKEGVLASDKTLVIGAKPNPDDTHIWEPLAKSKTTLGFVCSRADFDCWVEKEGRQNVHFLGERWQDCFNRTLEFLR